MCKLCPKPSTALHLLNRSTANANAGTSLSPFQILSRVFGFLPHLFVQELLPPSLSYSQVKAVNASPFLFLLSSSVEKFYFSPFYIRSCSLASLKWWCFVFCVCVLKLLPTRLLISSTWFHEQLWKWLITEVHSIPSYTPPTCRSMDWK